MDDPIIGDIPFMNDALASIGVQGYNQPVSGARGGVGGWVGVRVGHGPIQNCQILRITFQEGRRARDVAARRCPTKR